MPCSLDRDQFGSGRNQLKRRSQFFHCAERIPGSLDKQTGRLQIREMLRAQLLRLARRVQGIREQEKACSQIRVLAAKHRRLPSSIGGPTQKSSAGDLPF